MRKQLVKCDDITDTSPASLYKLNSMLRNLFLAVFGNSAGTRSVVAANTLQSIGFSSLAVETGNATPSIATEASVCLQVDASGGGDFCSLQEALDSLPKHLAHDVVITCPGAAPAPIHGDVIVYGFCGPGNLVIDLGHASLSDGIFCEGNHCSITLFHQ